MTKQRGPYFKCNLPAVQLRSKPKKLLNLLYLLCAPRPTLAFRRSFFSAFPLVQVSPSPPSTLYKQSVCSVFRAATRLIRGTLVPPIPRRTLAVSDSGDRHSLKIILLSTPSFIFVLQPTSNSFSSSSSFSCPHRIPADHLEQPTSFIQATMQI